MKITNSYVLLYGPRKGGTSLLQRLIDSEKNFCHPSETKIKNFPKLIETLSESFVSDESRKNFDIVADFFPVSYERELKIDKDIFRKIILGKITHIKNLGDYVDLHFEAVIESSAVLSAVDEDVKKSRVLKEVGGDTDLVIQKFLNAFPNGKVISIMRDPKWVSRAVFRDRRRRNVSMTPREWIHQITAPISVSKKQANICHPQIFTVHYDQIINNPDGTLKKIFTFCEMPFSEINLYPSIFGLRTKVDTSSKDVSVIFKDHAELSSELNWLEYFFIQTGRLWWTVEKIFSFVLRTVSRALLKKHWSSRTKTAS